MLTVYRLFIAEVYKNEDDDVSSKRECRNAIYFYTEGLKVKCKDDELNIGLLRDRAKAYIFIGMRIFLSYNYVSHALHIAF